ncbi:hypothetical protein PABG_00202 [Paracoccidioides brasiliensis Pb03]|nr:hypothetical protein PABG_00202 [Paracoccidioides brasiliensis Pb03]
MAGREKMADMGDQTREIGPRIHITNVHWQASQVLISGDSQDEPGLTSMRLAVAKLPTVLSEHQPQVTTQKLFLQPRFMNSFLLCFVTPTPKPRFACLLRGPQQVGSLVPGFLPLFSSFLEGVMDVQAGLQCSLRHLGLAWLAWFGGTDTLRGIRSIIIIIITTTTTKSMKLSPSTSSLAQTPHLPYTNTKTSLFIPRSSTPGFRAESLQDQHGPSAAQDGEEMIRGLLD